MNVKASVETSDAEPTAGEAAVAVEVDAAAKPQRRKRAAKPAPAAEAAAANAAAASEPSAAAAIDSGSEPAAVDSPATAPRPRRRAPAKRSEPLVEVSADAADRAADAVGADSQPLAEPAPLASAAQPQETDALPAEADGSQRSSRNRRRRGKRGADTPFQAAPPADGVGHVANAERAAVTEAVRDDAAPPVEDAAPASGDAERDEVRAGDVFAEVLSGAFDAQVDEAPAEPAVPHKRVLLPEPDAPKLHKVLAQAGIGSRRDMEQLIVDGLITVNGAPAHTGQRISFGDQIAVRGKPVRVRIVAPPPRIIAYHKPVGEVVTHDDPQHRPTVFRRLPRLQQGKWQAVGRLDLNTEGLLLFTNSGELANQLMHPRFGVEREYAVRVLGTLDEEDKAMLLEGVEIDGQTAAFRSIEDGGGEGANRWYRVVIAEGRNREVRKLFAAVDLTVSRLIRIRYGNVVLPRGLRRGAWVDLDDADVQAIRRLAGPRDNRPAQPQPGRGKKRGRDGERAPRPDGRPAQRPETAPSERIAVDRSADDAMEDDFDPARIPNPLEQTFDKRFVQNPRSPAGGRGFGRGGGGFGAGGSAPPAQKKGGPKEPDPLQTSVGYIGADAFHRKSRGGPHRGSGGSFGGGQRGGSGGGRRGR